MIGRKKLLQSTEEDIRQLKAKEKRPATLVGILFYGGTLGILFVLPVVGGAYLGRWLDSLVAGYSVRWTVSLIVLGIALGTYNVMRFIGGKV
jgi:ATP synthase protein I